MFASAATGVALAVALTRALARRSAQTLGTSGGFDPLYPVYPVTHFVSRGAGLCLARYDFRFQCLHHSHAGRTCLAVARAAREEWGGRGTNMSLHLAAAHWSHAKHCGARG